uniref:C-type lectin domain-containing protein n=1 Tax=Steinernema glaseri TaxID=37863 RepID=A0A1I7Z287_9BILA
MATFVLLAVLFFLFSAEAKCPDGAVFNERTVKCLLLVRVPLVHADAETSCLALGGQLASLDKEDRRLISNETFGVDVKTAWIASKSRKGFRNRCDTVSLKNGRISAKNCENKLPYMCQRPAEEPGFATNCGGKLVRTVFKRSLQVNPPVRPVLNVLRSRTRYAPRKDHVLHAPTSNNIVMV